MLYGRMSFILSREWNYLFQSQSLVWIGKNTFRLIRSNEFRIRLANNFFEKKLKYVWLSVCAKERFENILNLEKIKITINNINKSND